MDLKSSVRISVVSYLNSKPFIFGLKNAKFNREVTMQEDIPSVCADKLIRGNADIGLVPVAALPEIKNYNIISDYCIGADGPVSSVLLLSDVPLNEIETILLDYQSRTSVLLTQVMADNFWQINPMWESTNAGFENKIGKQTAGVVIGDRALRLKNKFRYTYDLGDEWKKHTGLPFVFACWVSTLEPDNDFLSTFNNALKSGLSNIDTIAIEESSDLQSADEIRDYLNNFIDYRFDDPKKKSLELFLKMAGKIENAIN